MQIIPVVLLISVLFADAEMEKGDEIPCERRCAIVFSSDGSKLFFLQKYGNPSLCRIRSSHGSEPGMAATLPVGKEMILSLMSSASFSADGEKVASLTIKEGVPRTRFSALRAGVIEMAAELRVIPVEFGPCLGMGFSGNDLVVLEGKDPEGEETGYELVRWSEGKRKVVARSGDGKAILLRISPDGKMAALALMEGRGFRKARIRVVDLKQGEAVAETETFNGDDLDFDERWYCFHWDATGEGIFYAAQEGRYFIQYCLDVASNKSSRVVIGDNLVTVFVLDENHLVVQAPRERDARSIFRISDKKLFSLPEDMFILGGRGNRVAVREGRTVFLATISLGKADESGSWNVTEKPGRNVLRLEEPDMDDPDAVRAYKGKRLLARMKGIEERIQLIRAKGSLTDEDKKAIEMLEEMLRKMREGRESVRKEIEDAEIHLEKMRAGENPDTEEIERLEERIREMKVRYGFSGKDDDPSE